MNKHFVIIGVVFVAIMVFAVTSMNKSDDNLSANTFNDKSASIEAAVQSNYSGNPESISSSHNSPTDETKAADAFIAESASELPVDVSLLGLVFSKQPEKSYAELSVDSESDFYKVDDDINNLSVYLKSIDMLGVALEYESRDYRLDLTATNSLEEEQLKETFATMTAKEIGARPRQIEHIVRLLPNNFNDGGKVIIPGVNPSLFKSAGFQEGDVLLEVNGFNLDDEGDFNDIQKDIRSAQTLTFKVNRAGRMITLYLDIPHETLKF